MKKILLIAAVACLGLQTKAQFVSIISQTTVYSEDFNSLSTTGTLQTTLPNGWWIAELPGNFTYQAGAGTITNGDTYSFGSVSSSDRSIGSLASGSVSSNFGARYINNSGSSFSSFAINLIMEQWRSGGRTGLDSLYFFYSVNGNNDSAGFVKILNGNWTRYSAADMVSKVTQPAASALDGNATANRQAYSFQVSGITVNPGDTLYLRWRDPNVAGSDDGLSIDSFSFVASTAPIVAAPSPVTNFTLTGLTKSTADITWHYPTVYSDTTTTILVFAKKGSAITAGTPTISAANYSAGSDLTMPGTAYQNDPAAFCVYKGDGSGFTLSSMEDGATYYLLSYIVTDADSIYSTAVTVNGTSSSKPASVSNTIFTSGGQSSAQISWTQPANYDDMSYTTLVFVKPDSALAASPDEVWAANYLADTAWGGTSSTLTNDPLARCMLNGDASSVSITGLTANTTYYVSVYTFRQDDSTYSNATSTHGTTEGLHPNPKPALNVSVDSIGYHNISLAWSHDVDYADSNHAVLVFAKWGSAVTTGANMHPSSAYTASATFGAGSPYANDSNAFCVYNGDDTATFISSLQHISNYHFLVYVVRDTDTTYSSAVTTDATTLELAPETVSGITVTGTSQTTVRVNWTKTTYDNARYTTLVFAKAGTINAGTVNKGVTAYTASTALGTGTPFDADANAFCVFKGDTNFVNITGLSSQTLYDIKIFVMRDVDSVESIAADGNGSTQGPPPHYTIGSINTTNPTTGLADSNGVRVTVKGTVYGFNQRASGVQFLLKDTTGGITLFHASKNFGYTVLEGDWIEAEGLINTFRGLNEITVDTIRFVSGGHPVDAPRKVQILTEGTENDLVKLDSIRFVTTPANGVWPSASTNIRVITPANDTLTVRVISTSGLAGKTLPTTPLFSIAGIGSQNTTATALPYPFTGYQLFPRSQNDVTEITVVVPADSLTPFHLLVPNNADTIVVNASNLNDVVVIKWSASTHSNGIDPTQYTLWIDTLGGDFGNPYEEIDNGSDTSFSITKQDIKDLIIDPLQLPQGGLFAGSWQVTASAGSLVRTSEETYSIYILNDISTGLAEQLLNERISLSPNPAIGHTSVNGLQTNDLVQLMDITGKVVFTQQASQSTLVIPTLDLNAGVYFVRIQNRNSAVTRKLVVQ